MAAVNRVERYRALGQDPNAVEYSDFSNEILVSLMSSSDLGGKAIVLDLATDAVNAEFPAAINDSENVAIWHPGKLILCSFIIGLF
jgi:hypothetical protein